MKKIYFPLLILFLVIFSASGFVCDDEDASFYRKVVDEQSEKEVESQTGEGVTEEQSEKEAEHQTGEGVTEENGVYTVDYNAMLVDTWELGGGQVSAEPYVEDGVYAKGSTVTIIQQPFEGYEFSHFEVWKEVDGGEWEMVESSTEQSIEVVVDSYVSVSVFYKPIP